MKKLFATVTSVVFLASLSASVSSAQSSCPAEVAQAKALLAQNPDPDEAQIREALRFNLCRCGTHVEIVRAVQRAAVLMRQAGEGAVS